MKYISALLFSLAAALAADVLVIDEIIAKVNGDIITKSELERTKRDVEAQLKQQQQLSGQRLAEAMAGIEKNILKERIDNLLLTQKGKELNINVDSEVSKQLADIQRKYKIADPEKFQQFIKEQTGQPFEDYRNEFRNYLIQQRVVRQEVGSTINIRKEELRKYYDENQKEFERSDRVFLSEILVSTEGKNEAEISAAEKKAKDLATRARNEKFPELAQGNSDSPSAAEGGFIGPWQKGQLKKEIEDLVWNQPKGYVTAPYKADNGFLIFRVEEMQKAGLATFEEVENEIMNKMYPPRMEPAMKAYLIKLREMAFLEIKPGYLDTGAAPGKDTTWSDPAQLKPEITTREEVLAQIRRKRLLWMVPVPGTATNKTGTSSSR